MQELQHFFSLTPERVLGAVERIGESTTGLCYALNSLENRVYEVELENRRRVVAKFYRPGRWSQETIADEHRLLLRLVEEEIPACGPLEFPDGSTLQRTEEGIWFAVFPRRGGRAPEELGDLELEQLGRLLGRIHNIAAATELSHRPALSPKTYGSDCLAIILERAELSPGVRERYADAVRRLVALAEPMFAGVPTQPVHADFHRGNILHTPEGWLVLDFDDMAWAPAVQDFWLVLPGRPSECPREVEALVRGYEQFRAFDHATLHLIEHLRALRYVRYAAWIAARWDDPSFPRAFPQWGTDNYWENQLADLNDQLGIIAEQAASLPL